jgi:integrase
VPNVKLTPKVVETAGHVGDRKNATFYWDERLIGFALAVYPSGKKMFLIQYRVKSSRRSRRMTIGHAQRLDLDVARKRGRELLAHVDLGRDPLTEQRRASVSTFRALAENYLTREGQKLRTAAKRRAILERAVFPVLGDLPVENIKRSDVIRLLDKIEDDAGPVAADASLSIVRRILSWHEARVDDYRSPIGRGMNRSDREARDRVLTDDEIRSLWGSSESFTRPWGAFTRLLLLTAARRTELAQMTRDEVSGALWTLPAERVKNDKQLVLPLSRAAQEIIAAIPTLDRCRFIFTIDGRRPISGFSKAKAAIDKASGVTGWTFHDLRRTARTLLSRAGVDADTAERCLGHAIGGVRGLYDRHKYEEQMRVAFEKLANMIEQIVDPTKGKVIQFPA